MPSFLVSVKMGGRGLFSALEPFYECMTFRAEGFSSKVSREVFFASGRANICLTFDPK
jgi:hypothetical protein